MAETFRIEGSHLVFGSNFGGDPKNEYVNFPTVERKGNIAISDPDILNRMAELGVRIGETRPSDPERYEPERFVTISIKYRGEENDPRVYLVTNGKRVLLTPESLGTIDRLNKRGGSNSSIEKVNCIVNTWRKDDEHATSLWVNTMYVYQKTENDPWASMFNDAEDNEEDPF